VRQAVTDGALARLPGLAARAGAATRGIRTRFLAVLRALPAPGPRTRRRIALVLLALLVLAGSYRLWIRDAPFASVDRVTVTGLSTEDAKRVRAALVSTARTMTTLHVERGKLDEVVAGYPVVRALEIDTDFPHAMQIRVVEHRPAAMVLTGSARIPVAADGTALEGLPVHGRLPLVRTRGGIKGTRLADPAALRAARIAGAAPAALRGKVQEIDLDGERGYVAQLRSGPEIIFGGASEVRSKWIAAARVLSDPDAQGASYVDVRVPARPAVGGLGFQVTPPELPAAPTALLEQGAVAGATAAGTELGAAVPEADPAAAAPPVAEPPTTTPEAPVTPAPEAGGGVAVAPSP
jgi:cell division protein FtsQ